MDSVLLLSVFAQTKSWFKQSQLMKMRIPWIVLVRGLSHFFFSLLLDCNPHDRRKKGPPFIPLEGLKGWIQTQCVQAKSSSAVELMPWEYLLLCNVVSRACSVGWTSQSINSSVQAANCLKHAPVHLEPFARIARRWESLIWILKCVRASPDCRNFVP